MLLKESVKVETGGGSYTQACSLQRMHHAKDSNAEVVPQLLHSVAVDALDEEGPGHCVELHKHTEASESTAWPRPA